MRIIILREGVCSFAEKAAHVQAAGAVVAIIYDNDEENAQHYVDMVKEDYVRNTPPPLRFVSVFLCFFKFASFMSRTLLRSH